MSLTRKSSKVFSEGFEIGYSVCDCFLKKIAVVETDKGLRVDASYLKGDKWITKFIAVNTLSNYNDEAEYRKAKQHAIACIENIAACYLSAERMKNILLDSTGLGLHYYIDQLREAFEEVKYWDTPVCLKTLPKEGGGAEIARFPYFVVNKKKNPWKLSYTSRELDYYFKKLEK